MGRFYRLSKKISEQEASEITREILELPDIQNAEIVDGKVRVETKDNVFVDVMSTVVNIFSQADVSFPLLDLPIGTDWKFICEMVKAQEHGLRIAA